MNHEDQRIEEQGDIVESVDSSHTPASHLNIQTSDTMKRAAKQLIERYYFQLVDGCGQQECANEFCASSTSFTHKNLSKNQAALQAIELFKNKAKLCESRPSKVAKGSHETSGASTSSAASSSTLADGASDAAIASTSSLSTPTVSSSQASSSQSVGATPMIADDSNTPSTSALSAPLYTRTTPTISPSRSRNSQVQPSTKSAAPEIADPPSLTEDQLHEIIETCDAASDWSLMNRTIGSIFNNPDSLKKSFLKQGGSSKEKEQWIETDLDKDKDESSEREEEPMDAETTAVKSSFKTAPDEITLDLESVRRAFKELFGISELPFLPALIHAIVYLSKTIEMDLRYYRPFERDAEYLNIFLIIMEIPELQNTEFLEAAFPQFCKTMGLLPVKAQAKVARVWSTYSPEKLRDFLDTLQQMITVKTVATEWTRNYCVNDDDGITGAAKVLKILYYASILAGELDREEALAEEKRNADEADDNLNEILQGVAGSQQKEKSNPKVDPLGKELGVVAANCRQPLIPWIDFVNEALSDTIEMDKDYTYYKADNESKFTFMTHSFLLTTAVKNLGLYFDNRIRMMNERRTSLFQSLVHGAPTTPYLRLRIRRDHIIDDALVSLEMIAMDNPQDLKKQLYVEFEGEQGIDEGGVSKEFFQLVVEEIFNPDIGMFTYDEGTRLFWFNPTSFENDGQFTLIGVVLGLAIYNNVILDVHFPMVVYRKLMGKIATFGDLKDSHPTLARSLQSMLDYEGDVEDTFMQNFSISYQDVFGTTLTHDLKEHGADIPVTNLNRQEYVDLYSDFLLNKSIEKQFKALFRGFHMVTDESPLKVLFRPDEIELLVCGSQNFDFKDLERATEYDGGFTNESTTIKQFWEVVHEFSEEQQRLLLQFTTGSDRVPVGGLSKLKLIIAKNGPDSDRLPTSHTCFNVLLLPDYQDKEKLKERLTKAITYAKGFGML